MQHYAQNTIPPKTLIDIEYGQPLTSLVDTLLYKSQVNIVDGIGGSYSVLFYTMIEGRKVNHDGIDQEGLLKHLIQACMDQINDLKLFEEDDEGFLFVRRFQGFENCCTAEQDELNRLYFGVGVFLVFLLTQEHKVPFKLKDELLYYLSTDEELIPYQDFYFDYDSVSAAALTLGDDYAEMARE